ncbi:MAG: di-trans,poly-cis-decaprenylcistransferase [Puniceicoccales bacterium]|jgi:undecaprenyl diphosphate synthase|nr:di-trans,poly-cis-decaprenylcistransferase [Puniceicoccales bacterium]
METPLKHVALILDGNGRWAKQRNLSRSDGHKEGAKRAFEIAQHAFQHWHIPFVTFFAFSTENWQRPKLEVNTIFRLLNAHLKKQRANFIKEKIRLHTLGDIAQLPSNLYATLMDIKQATSQFTEYNLVLALNYGAREEILRAIKLCTQTSPTTPSLNWKTFSRYLYTADMPDPDLVIRTSGEMRLSNYLCLQSAYSELYFTPTYWPDFNKEAFNLAIEDYQKRERRFGNAEQ